MKNKELINFLKKYDGDVEVKLGWLMKWFDDLIDYYEEPMQLHDIIESNYNWKTRLIFTMPSLNDSEESEESEESKD